MICIFCQKQIGGISIIDNYRGRYKSSPYQICQECLCSKVIKGKDIVDLIEQEKSNISKSPIYTLIKKK